MAGSHLGASEATEWRERALEEAERVWNERPMTVAYARGGLAVVEFSGYLWPFLRLRDIDVLGLHFRPYGLGWSSPDSRA